MGDPAIYVVLPVIMTGRGGQIPPGQIEEIVLRHRAVEVRDQDAKGALAHEKS